MRHIILASHGELCKGMLNSLSMIIGEGLTKDIQTYSLYPGESATDFADELKKQILAKPEDEFVIVADVLGGSVHTALMQILQPNVTLYSGMNMSMMLEVITSGAPVFDNEMAMRIKQAGVDGITCMNVEQMTDVEEEDF